MRPSDALSEVVTTRRRESLLQTVVNPFENTAPSGCYETCKYVTVGCTLFPIRLVLGLGCQFGLIFVTKIATLGYNTLIEDRGCLYHKEPLPWYRKLFLAPVPLLTRGLLFASGFWYISVTDRRKKTDVKPNVVVLAPHVGMFDGWVATCALGGTMSAVAKKELTYGTMGKIMSGPNMASQLIFVDRFNKDSRQACKEAIAARADSSWKGPPTGIAPEGTCTNGKALIAFKHGPFLPGKPVQPVVLKYPARHLSLGWTGDYAGGSGMGSLMLRAMLQFANYVHVEIMEPWVPSEAEVKDAALFANNVRKKMADSLGVGVTEHSYADAAMSLKAIPLQVGSDFEVGDVTARFGLTSDQLLSFLKEFKVLDKDHSGALSLEEFTEVVGKSGSEALKNPRVIGRLFQLFDTDHTGFLSYRELVQALAMLSSHPSEGRIKLCFLLCDPRDDGLLPKEMLQKALESAAGQLSPELKAKVDKLPAEINYKGFSELAEQQAELLDAMVALMPTQLSKVPEKKPKQ